MVRDRIARVLTFLDTHAGTGRYDLTHDWARKNAEYKTGISLVWPRRDAPSRSRSD